MDREVRVFCSILYFKNVSKLINSHFGEFDHLYNEMTDCYGDFDESKCKGRIYDEFGKLLE